MNIEVSYSAIFFAGFVANAIGFFWYSPYLLGKQWMKERGYTKDSLKSKQKEARMWYVVSFVVSLITAYVLNHVMALSMNFYNYAPVATGVITAFWMWLGFLMPVQLMTTLFGDKRNWRLLGIDTGYQLVSILAMGVVIGLL